VSATPLAVFVDGRVVEGAELLQAILLILVAIGVTGDIRASGRSGTGISFAIPSLDGVRRTVSIVPAPVPVEPAQVEASTAAPKDCSVEG
jgi:hypothetical protein